MKRLRRLILRGVALLVGIFIVYQSWIFGSVVWWIWFNPSTTAFMQSRIEAMRDKDPGAQIMHKWIPYDRVSVHLKRALIAAEDAKFLDHGGFDWEAIQQAAEKNLRKG
ncbi:MAG: transglycosylase domain-containing protein, partial [Burkholderiales bacterium]